MSYEIPDLEQLYTDFGEKQANATPINNPMT